MSNTTLFALKTGRLNFLKDLALWPVYAALHAVTRRHIQQGRRQLAVFSFDHIAHNINLFGVYERAELETFFRWLQLHRKASLGGVALDIGANIGNHSLFFSDYFSQVVSFEPNPRSFKVLELNAALVTNVTCKNIGLSDADGIAHLTLDPNNVGGSSLHTAGGAQQEITLKKLDSLGIDEKVSLIKIDVEGHEHKALLGARQLITTQRPLILFEQHNNDFVNGRSQVIELLRDYGYEQFAIVMPSPHFPYAWPKLLRLGLTALCGLVLGKTMRVTLTTDIRPSFYPFIVALPD